MTRSGFRPAASADVEAAYEWYEAQRPGLGDEFIVAVDAAVASILAFPDAYPVVHRGARRVLLERFPYGLFEHFDYIVTEWNRFQEGKNG